MIVMLPTASHEFVISLDVVLLESMYWHKRVTVGVFSWPYSGINTEISRHNNVNCNMFYSRIRSI